MKENQFCGCCLSEDCDKDMFKYLNVERKETYAEILSNTLNINLQKHSNAHFICKDCITKLQQASEFKQQVLKAQDNIINGHDILKFDTELKIEIADLDDDEVTGQLNHKEIVLNDNQSHKGQVSVIKSKPNNDAEKKESLAEAKASGIKKTRRKKSNSTTKLKDTSNKAKVKQKSCGKYEVSPKTHAQIDTRDNSMKLVLNSNLCLFRSLKTKFGCYMCKNTFVEARALREHSYSHTKSKYVSGRLHRWHGKTYKNADISNLECNICAQNVTDLSNLMSHLTDKHGITFSGTGIYLIPYKLSDDNQCALCEKKFNSFLRLSIHMNSHYTNNVCEICGLSYINRLSLRTHIQRMHKENKCSHCSAKFSTESAKVAHLKKVHKVFNMKRYCNLCEKTFPYTYLLNKHKIAEHGAPKKTAAKCTDCGKIFLDESNLKVHKRSVHIGERNYPCQICGTCFFTKFDQKRHEKTHEDVKSFSCDYCDGKLKTKNSWRRHMKTQHGHVFIHKHRD